MENLTYNYVLSGLQGAQAIILKLGMDRVGLNREAMALKAFAPFGVVKILKHHDHALLLERVSPGNSLKSYFPAQEAEGILIAYDVMTKLHQAPLPSANLFPSISDWLTALDKEWDIPFLHLEKARRLKDHLLATAKPSALLHGDLHHDNILQNKTGWTVIDPKGVWGEPAYEIAAFIRNPLPEILESRHINKIIANRIESFSHLLGLEKKRLQQWCFVQAVLSWAWALEDGINPASFKHLTEVFNFDN